MQKNRKSKSNDPSSSSKNSQSSNAFFLNRAPLNNDYVEFEVTRALEWLSSPREARRLAACCVLAEVARANPGIFFTKTNVVTQVGGPIATTIDDEEDLDLAANGGGGGGNNNSNVPAASPR